MAYVSRKAEFDAAADPGAALGQYRGGRDRATIYDVARDVGVSAITVSRALNGGSCSAKTRNAVQQAAKRLGYQPNAAAQALASRKRRRSPLQSGHRAKPPAGMPDLWQSYADMMLKLVKSPA